MTEHLPLNVEWKAAPDGSGELEGYMSVFNNVDLGGDVVLPGAFRKTLADRSRAKSPMPLMVDHDTTWDGLIGTVVSAAEDGHGVKVRARFLTDPKSQGVRQKMIDSGGSGMSFTYVPIRFHMGTKNGEPVRYLDEVKVLEATVTWVPMNMEAYALAKAVVDVQLPAVEPDPLLPFVKDLRTATAISDDTAMLAAVKSLLASASAAIAADEPDGAVTADDDVDTVDTSETFEPIDPGYALRLVQPDGPPDGAPGDTYPERVLRPIETAHVDAELDALEAEIRRAQEG